MRLSLPIIAGVAALGFAGEALAQAAQCYVRTGGPYGPVYRMENPERGWVEWVRRMGGYCRPISEFERQSLEQRPQYYPEDFRAWARGTPQYRPPGNYPPQGPGYDDERDWRGDSARAAYLTGQWLAQQGRPYAQVIDTGRVEFIYNRQWRIFFARWQDGSRARIAVRFSRRDGGTYQAMQSYGGGAWGQPQPIGQ